ncbi:MAG: transglycosylase SLT domain-containing protein [Burkholderiales bacterium]|nr:transglycosylase SLT domain-containing protein [Burkholderiales bacterium]MBK8665301.1 transglycosylase SLT domain-containing protein [Burkholderiales bacterium]
MRWFSLLALAASVWVAGCAAPGTAPSTDSPQGTASATGAPVRAAPYTGDMPPLTMTELRTSAVAPLDAPADLWDRIRRGFSMRELDGELVTRHEQWYVSRPDYIERMVDRSRMYIFHIVEELELRGMPTELALLPYIESAFNPQAVSSAKAAGMWQFMPGTGRDFRLTQNVLRDDRRDVLDSTRAALDYLQKLHDMFGDWHLALAAYNWGQGNVKRAIDRNQAAGLGTGYLDLSMPAETRNYVPKLQAVKNIIASPQAHGAVLPLIENHPFFDTVDITHDIDIDIAARLAEVRLEDFRALNPAQRKPVIFAAGTPQVLLPWNNADIFKRNLAKAAPGSLSSWTAWVAPQALPSREVASRFGMDEDDFREINNVPRGMVIKSGSTVLVRRGNGATTQVASHVVNNAQLAYTPEIVLRRTTVRARRGDSIASVAARYDLPAATVAGWNHTGARAGLKRGQAVVLFLPVRAAAAAARDGVAASQRAARAHAAPATRSSAKAPARAAAKSSGKSRSPAQAAAKRATAAPKAGSRAAPAKGKATKRR